MEFATKLNAPPDGQLEKGMATTAIEVVEDETKFPIPEEVLVLILMVTAPGEVIKVNGLYPGLCPKAYPDGPAKNVALFKLSPKEVS